MDEKQKIKTVRRGCNTVGLTLLAYYGIMNVAVIFVMIIDMIVYIAKNFNTFDMDLMMTYVVQSMLSNGWGYLLAIAVGGIIVLCWKGRDFWKNEVFAVQKKMTLGVFWQLLCVFLSTQALLQLLAPLLEWLLNLIGLSALAALETASMTATGVSMFLYLAFFAPIAEELLFRGLVLRLLQPYGKQLAILASALLFGLFHGNVVQGPFAFLVGVVLGYVTIEYSVVWAIILHIINNFVLSDLLNRLSGLVPDLGEWIFLGVIIAAAAATVVLLIVRRKEVAVYLKENKLTAVSVKGFFSAPGVLIFGILLFLMSLMTITPV